MCANARKIIDQIKNEKSSKKRKVTLIIDESLYVTFQKICGKETLAVSKVIEKMVADFVDSYSDKKER